MQCALAGWLADLPITSEGPSTCNTARAAKPQRVCVVRVITTPSPSFLVKVVANPPVRREDVDPDSKEGIERPGRSPVEWEKARHVLVESPQVVARPPASERPCLPARRTCPPKLPMVASNGSGIPERLANLRLRLWRIAR